MYNPIEKEKTTPAKTDVDTYLNENDEDFEIGESIGGFSGYNRRPASSSTGLTASFFGENGKNADVISVLHLTRYLDLPVKVTVWLIKDNTGRLIKKNGNYIKITEFIGAIRRPKASMGGQTAQFFGANGLNSDAVNALNKTEYVDALVYIEMQKADANMLAEQIKTPDPIAEIERESTKLTEAELKEVKVQQRKAVEANRILTMNGFYHNTDVHKVIGTPEDFKNWVRTQPCCSPGARACPNTPVLAFTFAESISDKYNFIPLCKNHVEAWESGEEIQGVVSLISFARNRKKALLAEWTKQTIRALLGIPKGSEIPPKRLYTWAIENNLQKSIPSGYMHFF